MKLPTILGLGGVPPGPGGTLPTTFDGHGLLSRALALPEGEYERRERRLKAYLEARVGHIIAGNDTIH
jgi:hypothetical protein